MPYIIFFMYILLWVYLRYMFFIIFGDFSDRNLRKWFSATDGSFLVSALTTGKVPASPDPTPTFFCLCFSVETFAALYTSCVTKSNR